MVKPNFVAAPDAPRPMPARDSVAFVGRLSREKGISLLLQAWQLAGLDAELWVMGDGPLRSEVELAAKTDHRIRVWGEIDHSLVLDNLRQCACLIFPSLGQETFGRSIIEAFSAGVPVLAANLGASQEMVISEYNGFFFRPGDAKSAAETLQNFWQRRDLWKRLRRHARSSYETFYTPQENYRQIMAIYEAALTDFHAV